MIRKTATKEQNKIKMNWTIVEESLPDKADNLSDVRDELSNKLGLKKLSEFVCDHRCNDNNSRSSCSFISCTSSNIDRKALSLNESTIFAELFLKLTHKN